MKFNITITVLVLIAQALLAVTPFVPATAPYWHTDDPREFYGVFSGFVALQLILLTATISLILIKESSDARDRLGAIKDAMPGAVVKKLKDFQFYVHFKDAAEQAEHSVNAGTAVQYNFTLPAQAKLLAQFQVQGGLNDKIRVLLLDGANYQLFTAHQPFKVYPGTSGSVRGIGKYEFRVPQAGVYYVVLDNGKAWLMPRKVTLHLDAILPQSTPASEEIRTAFENEYSMLKKVFVFHDFQTFVRHCGIVNAFSNPNITLCVELIEELQANEMTPAVTFVYLHELGHTLMKEWGLPLWDNEDAADEFATAFLLMGKQQAIALTAAQWWGSESVNAKDAIAKIWMDDRHSLSPQRARNIIHWVNNRNDLVPRWEHVFIPNMQTAVLESMLRDPAVSEKDSVRSELRKRGAPSE